MSGHLYLSSSSELAPAPHLQFFGGTIIDFKKSAGQDASNVWL